MDFTVIGGACDIIAFCRRIPYASSLLKALVLNILVDLTSTPKRVLRPQRLD